jgi:hypothetical protein
MALKHAFCYVIMPFSSTKTLDEEGWHRVFAQIFKPTFEFLGFDCIRSEVKTGSILQHIVTNIHGAFVVVADLTDNKPNVLYELGIAHAINDRVIMVSQKIDESPSDLKPYGIIPYTRNPKHEDTIRFQSHVKDALTKVNSLQTQTGPVSQYLGRTIHSLEFALSNPVAIMECTKCHLRYEVRIGETTQSDITVDMVDNQGKRTHPIGIEHQKKGLCGHWESTLFLGLKAAQP